MRKMGLLASAAALAVGGSMAKADFVVNFQKFDLGTANSITSDANGAGQMAGFDMILLYAENTGTNNTGTKLNSVSVTLSDHTLANNLVIGGYTKASPTATSTAELINSSEIFQASTGAPYSFFGTQLNATTQPKYYTVVTILGDPSSATDSNPANILTVNGGTPPNNFTTYQYAIHSFGVSIGSSIQGVNATTANGGEGALFGAVVVPHGDDVDFAGSFGGNSGSLFPFAGTTAVPEPMTAGLFGIGLAGLAARRRRQA